MFSGLPGRVSNRKQETLKSAKSNCGSAPSELNRSAVLTIETLAENSPAEN
jgi:hypothetical protein